MLWTIALFAVYNVVAISDYGQGWIAREVHRELLRLPYYTVFDDLGYQVEDSGRVVLVGAVTNPLLKMDAENAIKAIRGVGRVENQIRVLPRSDADQHLRMELLRAIYAAPPLAPYGDQPVPAIHLVVEDGKVTLTGIVSGQTDREMAEKVAHAVAGVRDVSNQLAVEP